MINNYTKNRVSLILGGSATEVPSYFMIGTGSSTIDLGTTTLTTPADRQAFTTTDNGTYKVKWTADWTSTEMSGLNFSEFGITGSNAGTTGSMWSVAVIPSISFDGTNELRLQEEWEVY